MSNDAANIERGLRTIRLRRRIVWLVWLSYLPVMILFWRTFVPTEREGMAAAIVWMVGYAIAGMLVSLSRCPRCGERFHRGRWSRAPNNPLFAHWNPWTRRCMRCGLPLRRR